MNISIDAVSLSRLPNEPFKKQSRRQHDRYTCKLHIIT